MLKPDNSDNKVQESQPKKLTLSVRNLEQLESRASPNTACPEEWGAGQCCRTSMARAAKLSSVAYF